jgi:hypothetical protein
MSENNPAGLVRSGLEDIQRLSHSKKFAAEGANNLPGTTLKAARTLQYLRN